MLRQVVIKEVLEGIDESPGSSTAVPNQEEENDAGDNDPINTSVDNRSGRLGDRPGVPLPFLKVDGQFGVLKVAAADCSFNKVSHHLCNGSGKLPIKKIPRLIFDTF